MNDLSLALIRKGKGTGVVAGTTSHDLELALARKYGSGAAPAPTLSAYLTFESSDAFTITSRNGNTGKTWDGTLAYSTDAVHWFIWDGTKTLNSKENGGNHCIYLGGYDNTIITGNNLDTNFVISGTAISCTGDIRALLDHEKAAANEDPVMGDRCFDSLFAYNSQLTSAPSLPFQTLAFMCYASMFLNCTSLVSPPALPATTLTQACYASMFAGCTSLTSAPALPATALEIDCYDEMFAWCSSLTAAPTLPATTLADYCYSGMFQRSGLTAAPALPATTLAEMCYANMFYLCAHLTAAPALPATSLASQCYSSMFEGCTSLTAAPTLPATTLAERCYIQMFDSCTSLTAAPALPATTLANYCYANMLSGCTSLTSIPELPALMLTPRCYRSMFFNNSALKISTTQTAECPNAYRIPTTGTGTADTDSLTDMFYGTGGTFTGTPSINKTYYTNATIVPAA